MELRVFILSVYLGLSHQMVPWIGVLKVKVDNTEAVTGVILIKENVAIAVANEISELNNHYIRISARTLFYQNDEVSVCYVVGVKMHPQYYTNILNTIALIFLKCNTNFWSLIFWPNENIIYRTNLFIMGLKDRKKGFSQVTYGVREVNATTCLKFYANEGIDYKSLWPKYVMCVKASMKNQCVFDSGMALVHKNKEKWTLYIYIASMGSRGVLLVCYKIIRHFYAKAR